MNEAVREIIFGATLICEMCQKDCCDACPRYVTLDMWGVELTCVCDDGEHIEEAVRDLAADLAPD